ncbi:MAG: FAD-dependent 5-carboxymethylaminomethyl-2-thiouridine(34) oxidoreductase MnmC [Pseudomonadota bacterium]
MTELVDSYPPRIEGVHRLLLANDQITLDLVWGDGDAALKDLASFGRRFFDAWYLDGFAPAKNGEFWSADVLQLVANLSKPESTVASYTAAGSVRRSLERCGYEVRKRPGFAHKRECIQGRLKKLTNVENQLADWDLARNHAQLPARVLILGAGLAGSHAAAALARRGVESRVVDIGAIAGRASGNPQGVLFTRFSHQRSVIGDFSLSAFLYASRLYRKMLTEPHAAAHEKEQQLGQLCGCISSELNAEKLSLLRPCLEGLDDLAAVVNGDAAREKLGAPIGRPALWIPHSGWLSPAQVCRTLLSHPLIRVNEHGVQSRLEHQSGGWMLQSDEKCDERFSHAIIATGAASSHLPETQHLPLGKVRGQTTQLPAAEFEPLTSAFCHGGYLAPAVGGAFCVGSSFHPGNDSRDLSVEDHKHNLLTLMDALPEWRDKLGDVDTHKLSGRAEVRCVSPDYLPVVGPAADQSSTAKLYAPLKKKAKAATRADGAHQVPGLYLATAFGSRGLSYAALAGEAIASQICGDLPPLSRMLHRAIAPARFQIRAMIRGED